MTETLSRGVEYDPLLNYSAENHPPINEQKDFFRHALLEGMETDRSSKLVAGPLCDTFTGILKEVDARINDINPTYTAEYIMPWGYRSPEVKEAVMGLPFQERSALEDIGRLKLAQLKEVPRGPRGNLLNDQLLLPNLLDVPCYVRQKEDWKYVLEDSKGCTNACFRMIFGSITGWVPSQAAVSEELIAQYGTSVVDDSIYAGIYRTEVFSEICDKAVKTVEIVGADFTMISRLTERIKQRRPESEVYCTVNLESQTATNGVWHTAVLLEAGNGLVAYHDPSNNKGGAYHQAPVSEFLDRWAVAYNRATLTIAA